MFFWFPKACSRHLPIRCKIHLISHSILDLILGTFLVFAWRCRPKTFASEAALVLDCGLGMLRKVPKPDFWRFWVGLWHVLGVFVQALSLFVGACSENFLVGPQYWNEETLAGATTFFLIVFDACAGDPGAWFEAIMARCSYSVALDFAAGVMLHGSRLGFIGHWSFVVTDAVDVVRCAKGYSRRRSFVIVDDRNPGWLFRIQYVTVQYILPRYGSGFQCERTSAHVLVSFLASALRYSGNICLCFQLV